MSSLVWIMLNRRLPIDLIENPDAAKGRPSLSRKGKGDVNTGSTNKEELT